jgi:hypothetical protein
MPKVLQINIVANWGSTGRIAEQIGEKAMARGWESHIAYGRWKNLSKSHLIKIGFGFHAVFCCPLPGNLGILIPDAGNLAIRASEEFIQIPLIGFLGVSMPTADQCNTKHEYRLRND